MRVVKEAQERKKEILDVAEALFMTKGYEGTGTNDILNAVGIARGTLYHHFKSKEEILDAVIDRFVSKLSVQAEAVADNKEIPVFERIALSIMSMNTDTELGKELTEQMHKPQNALLHQKSQEKLLARINPIISGLIKEAVEQGICSTDYPDEMVEMIMIYSNQAFDDLAELSEEERIKKVFGFIYNVERLLCVEEGSLQRVILPIFQK